MSITNTFNLLDVLGWTDQKPCSAPVISVQESPLTSADVVTAAFIAHSIATGASVCLVGVRYSYTHYNYLCKKMDVNLDKMLLSGRLFFIDCMQIPQLHILNPESTTVDSFESLAGRIVIAKHRWLSLQSKPAPAPTFSSVLIRSRFNIVVDDLSLLADMWGKGLPAPAMAFARAMLTLARDTRHTLDLSSSSPSPAHTLSPGSLYLVTTPPIASHSFLTSLSAAPTPPAAPLAPPLLRPSRHRDKDPAAQYVDVGVATGGVAALVAHWAMCVCSDECAGLALELRALSSGYSRDIYAEMHVRVGMRADAVDTCVRTAVAEGRRTQGLVESVNGRGAVVYVSVGGDGSLQCHTRG